MRGLTDRERQRRGLREQDAEVQVGVVAVVDAVVVAAFDWPDVLNNTNNERQTCKTMQRGKQRKAP